MGDLSTDFLRGDMDVPCPACRYPVWVRLSEIVCQCRVLCRCCRTGIRLIDDRASMATAADEIERSLDEALRGLFR